ncbi:MAG: phosphoenolpyruvate--protein phosphotransferase, partial [Bacteroidales bacterium]|nr:phosphoenolpyruvate--protein phosphotransferase [Bacteroidales bacterium]
MRMTGRAFVLERKTGVGVPEKALSPVLDSVGQNSPEAELFRFHEAFGKVKSALETQAAESDIFAAHLEMLQDPMIEEGIEEAIGEGADAVSAVKQTCENVCAMFSEIDDEYLRARVDDVKDVCRRIEEELEDKNCSNPFADLPPGSIIVSEELFPSDTAAMDFSRIAGFIIAKGSATSHVCIIARSKGIPAVVGYDIKNIKTGDTIDIEVKNLVGKDLLGTISKVAGRAKLYANAGSVEDIRKAIDAGAEGIGLFRTEFIFISETRLPDFHNQSEIYLEALKACQGRPLTVRTLDIGGDKALPYLPMTKEDNPFLGLRGIRFCLANKDLLRTQLQALLDAFDKADKPCKLRIMFPMIDTPEELKECRDILL